MTLLDICTSDESLLGKYVLAVCILRNGNDYEKCRMKFAFARSFVVIVREIVHFVTIEELSRIQKKIILITRMVGWVPIRRSELKINGTNARILQFSFTRSHSRRFSFVFFFNSTTGHLSSLVLSQGIPLDQLFHMKATFLRFALKQIRYFFLVNQRKENWKENNQITAAINEEFWRKTQQTPLVKSSETPKWANGDPVAMHAESISFLG